MAPPDATNLTSDAISGHGGEENTKMAIYGSLVLNFWPRLYFLIVQVCLAFTDKLIFLVRKQQQTTRYCNTEPEHQLRHIAKLLQLPPIVTRLQALL